MRAWAVDQPRPITERPLQLLTRDEQPLTGGIEKAIVLDGGIRWHVSRNLALETSFGKAYWPGIDLGETRAGFGLVVTR